MACFKGFFINHHDTGNRLRLNSRFERSVWKLHSSRSWGFGPSRIGFGWCSASCAAKRALGVTFDDESDGSDVYNYDVFFWKFFFPTELNFFVELLWNRHHRIWRRTLWIWRVLVRRFSVKSLNGIIYTDIYIHMYYILVSIYTHKVYSCIEIGLWISGGFLGWIQ